MKRTGIVTLGILMLTGCGTQPDPKTVTVSAAMSLKDAFTGLAARFAKKHPGYRCRLNFGSSGSLARQLEGGAPADLYASASQKYMNQLSKQGLIAGESRRDFAANRLVAVAAAGGTAQLAQQLQRITALMRPFTGKIAIGNPRTVPCGRYAKEALQKAGVYSKLRGKTVLAEHVRQVVDYTVRKEVAVGFVYSSDYAVNSSKLHRLFTVDGQLHTPIRYPAALLKTARTKKSARLFLELLFSAEGGAILKQYGFTPTGGTAQ